MTTKERLHELVEELSELEADDALRTLTARRENDAAAQGVQPDDIVDEWGDLDAQLDGAAGDLMARLDEEEIAEFGETIAQAWGYESSG